MVVSKFDQLRYTNRFICFLTLVVVSWFLLHCSEALLLVRLGLQVRVFIIKACLLRLQAFDLVKPHRDKNVLLRFHRLQYALTVLTHVLSKNMYCTGSLLCNNTSLLCRNAYEFDCSGFRQCSRNSFQRRKNTLQRESAKNLSSNESK